MEKSYHFILDQKSSFWIYTAFVLSVLYLVGSSIAAYWRLRHFKGPPFAAWSFLWYLHTATCKQAHTRMAAAITKYGPLVRIGPNILVTSDPELYRRINARDPGYSRDYWYKPFRFGADKETVLSELDNNKHRLLRKRLAPGYSGKDNLCLEADIDNVIWSLVKSWRERYLSQGSTCRPMDLALQLNFLTLDVITALSFGEALGYLTSDSDLYEYISTTHSTFPTMNFCSAVPLISRMLGVPWIQRLLAPSTNDRIGLGKIKAVSNQIITRRYNDAQHKDGARVKSDMTGSFISHRISLDEATDNALLNILAGSDTTVIVMRAAIASIITQPKILRTFQAEIDAAQVPFDEIISHARCLELPYLQACIKEALRWNPPATGLLPRRVPPQGDYYNGQFIPGGTMIGQSGWSLHRLNYDVYGPDTNIFRPERWIEAAKAARAGNPEQLERMERCSELVFSSGDFKCLGYQISLMELGKVLFELFRRFEFGFIDAYNTMESNLNYGLFLQSGMWVKVEER